MEGYRKNGHAVYDIKFHVIWVTKYRYKVLQGHIPVKARELIVFQTMGSRKELRFRT